jgi:Protein of unknown function (DUF2442)
MRMSATAVRLDDMTLCVEPVGRSTAGVPVTGFPRSLHATPEQRTHYCTSVSGGDLHWEDLNADILVEGLPAGRGDVTVKRPGAA